jgi:thiol-disulfide isomerase/thioredoxin
MKVAATVLIAAVLTLFAYHSYRHETYLTKSVRYEIPDLGPAEARPKGPDWGRLYKAQMHSRNRSDSKIDSTDAENVGSTANQKVVHINFWASWCAPCLQELPRLEKLQNELGSRYLLLLVNADTTAEDVAAAKEMQKQLAPAVMSIYDENDLKLARELVVQQNVEGLPYHILIDQRGRTAAAFYANVDEKFEELKTLLTKLMSEDVNHAKSN